MSCFEIPELVVKDLIWNMAHLWNGGLYLINSVVQGQDWKVFLKVWTYNSFVLFYSIFFVTQCMFYEIVMFVHFSEQRREPVTWIC